MSESHINDICGSIGCTEWRPHEHHSDTLTGVRADPSWVPSRALAEAVLSDTECGCGFQYSEREFLDHQCKDFDLFALANKVLEALPQPIKKTTVRA